MSSISTGTTSTTGLVATSDTTGALVLKTGASATTAVTIDASQNVLVGGSTSLTNATLIANGGIAAKTAAASGITPYLQLYNGNASTDIKTWRMGAATAGSFTIESVNDAYTVGTGRMSIDSSGNMLIGNTAGLDAHLEVYGAGTTSTSYTNGDATGPTLYLRDSGTSANNGGQILFGAGQGIFAGIKGLITNGTGPAGDLVFQTRTTTGNVTEKMRINEAGNVGIGTASPANKFEVYGNSNRSVARASTTAGLVLVEAQASDYWSGPTYTGTSLTQYGSTATGTIAGLSSAGLGAVSFQNCTAGLIYTNGGTPLVFGTTTIERMRIDASGNVGVGTVGFAPAERFSVYNNSTSQVTAIVKNNATSGVTTDLFQVQSSQAAGTGYYLGRWYSGGAAQFGVRGDGLIYSAYLTGGATTLSTDAFGNIIRTVSDAALKTNVQPIQYGLNTVMKLKPIKHDWVKHINMGDSSIGFIAQDMELEVPEIVNGVEYKSIDYPKLTAVLVKAIQEQQALIESLTTRLTALEQK